MAKYENRIIRPKNREENWLINIAAVGHGILPLDNFNYEAGNLPTSAKRKFRKYWRKARKHLLNSNNRESQEDLKHYLSQISKKTLVKSAILSEEKNKLNNS